MRPFILAAVAAVLLLVAAGKASAHGGIVVRRTPFNPFRGPVVVNRGFHGVHRGFVPSYSRGFHHGGNVVVDQFGRTIIIR